MKSKIASPDTLDFPASEFMSPFGIAQQSLDPHRPAARHLGMRDLSDLRRLEVKKWGAEGATLEMLQSRIENAPSYSWGYYKAGEIIASCFVMGVSKQSILAAPSWHDVTDDGYATSHDPQAKTWFGISLSGSNTMAVRAVLVEVLLKMLTGGVMEVYLGSPIPSYASWKKKNLEGTAEQYVLQRRPGSKWHVDPLLSYYESLGFRIVCVKPNYFPHAKSDDYGVIINFRNPVWFMAPLIKMLPSRLVRLVIWKISKKI